MSKGAIYIAYGFCEGRRIGARFEAALIDHGFTVTRSTESADIILAHSAGCFVLPKSVMDKPKLFVGLPWSSGHALVKAYFANEWRWIRAIGRRVSPAVWVRTTLWNLIYMWNLPYDIRIIRGLRSGSWRQLEQVTVVHNLSDAFSATDDRSAPILPQAKQITLPGAHGDIWRNPLPYVQILETMSRTNL